MTFVSKSNLLEGRLIWENILQLSYSHSHVQLSVFTLEVAQSVLKQNHLKFARNGKVPVWSRYQPQIKTSQELRMLPRSLSDCRSLLLNLNLNRCLWLCNNCNDCNDCSDCDDCSYCSLGNDCSLTHWVSKWGTRSPIELSGTAKKKAAFTEKNKGKLLSLDVDFLFVI